MKFLFCAALVVVLAQAHATSLSLNTQFAGFKHTHSKKYADAFEEVHMLLTTTENYTLFICITFELLIFSTTLDIFFITIHISKLGIQKRYFRF